MGRAASHFLPDLDWQVKLAIGLPVALAGLPLLKPPRWGALRFTLGIFTVEAGMLIAIRGVVAANQATGGSSSCHSHSS